MNACSSARGIGNWLWFGRRRRSTIPKEPRQNDPLLEGPSRARYFRKVAARKSTKSVAKVVTSARPPTGVFISSHRSRINGDRKISRLRSFFE